MRGCRYTAPPLTSPGSVVCQLPTVGVYQRKIASERTIGNKFHNPIGAFRRKADYTYEDIILIKTWVFAYFGETEYSCNPLFK